MCWLLNGGGKMKLVVVDVDETAKGKEEEF